jgi:hypothetical protein
MAINLLMKPFSADIYESALLCHASQTLPCVSAVMMPFGSIIKKKPKIITLIPLKADTKRKIRILHVGMVEIQLQLVE